MCLCDNAMQTYMYTFFFFFYIKHLHSNIKPTVTRHTYINSYAWEKRITYKKSKKRAVTYM